MQKSNVVLCTLAHGERYRKLSLDLIRSVESNLPGTTMAVFTDDKLYYTDMNIGTNIHIFHIDIGLNEDEKADRFPYSAKLIPIEYCILNYDANVVIYLDADNIVSRSEDLSVFTLLREGVNCRPHHCPRSADNENYTHMITQVRERLDRLAGDDEIYLFIEQVIILKVDSIDRATGFINEWRKLYNQARTLGLYQHHECADIGIACPRSGYPLNDIGNSPIVDKVDYSSLFLTRTPDGQLNRTLA